MKVRNAVVGMEVQVKRDCRGHSRESLKGGLVCTIDRIDNIGADYELRLKHPDIDCGYAWVNASDVRRYIKPTESPEPVVKLTKGTRVQVKSTLVGEWSERLQEGDIYILNTDEDTAYDGTTRRLHVTPVGRGISWSTQPKYFDVLPDEVPDEPQDDIKVGDSVLVGSEGAGLGLVLKDYAGLVCSVVAPSYMANCARISHPDVRGGRPYASRTKYLTKVTPKPKELTLQDIQVGDWVVCSDDKYGLTVGVAYEVLRVHSDDGLYVSNPERSEWNTGFATRTHQFNKVLREVNDATPRMAQSGSESTCRSE